MVVICYELPVEFGRRADLSLRSRSVEEICADRPLRYLVGERIGCESHDSTVVREDSAEQAAVDVAPQEITGCAAGSAGPCPSGLTQSVQLAGGTTVALRPIRPDDAAAEMDFVHRLSRPARATSAPSRGSIDVSPALARPTHSDRSSNREMALVAVAKTPPGERLIGVARYAMEPGTGGCEFAIVVDDQWQGTGLARKLMDRLIDVGPRLSTTSTACGV